MEVEDGRKNAQRLLAAKEAIASAIFLQRFVRKKAQKDQHRVEVAAPGRGDARASMLVDVDVVPRFSHGLIRLQHCLHK